jgi:hypothetical protein
MVYVLVTCVVSLVGAHSEKPMFGQFKAIIEINPVSLTKPLRPALLYLQFFVQYL